MIAISVWLSGSPQLAAGQKIPLKGTVFVSVKDTDKAAVLPVAMGLHGLGFKILATKRHFPLSDGKRCDQ